ncbi:MAG: AI-2E family transporter [Armatimonadota bacterium]
MARPIPWARWIFYGVLALVALWLAWAARAIWFPVGVALAIAMVLDPTVDRLENRGAPRGLATTIVFLFFIAGAVVTILVLSPAVSQQAGEIAERLGQAFPNPEKPDLVPATRSLAYRLDAHPVLRDALIDTARAVTVRVSGLLERSSEWFLLWAPNLMWFLVVPVLAFYILNDFHRIYAKGMLVIPPRHRSFAQTVVAEVTAVLGSYLRGLALVCALLGVAVAIMLYALGNPYWGLMGLVAGLLYAIPVIGSIVTLALIVASTLMNGSPTQAAIAGGLFVVLYLGVFDQVVTPKVLGKQVGLHPTLTIIAFLIGYEVWGITGMLVAVPLAASAQRVVVHLVPKLRSELELRPLEELQRAEDETREEHLRAEDEVQDDHYYLHSVVENVEGETDGAETRSESPSSGEATQPQRHAA